MVRRISIFVVAAVVALSAHASDVTLQTDHPQYPGEGAFQTVEQCAEFATTGAQTSQEKAIAMYMWFLTHQWHLMSPMEWCVPGRSPDTADPGDYETVVFDANRARFSYGYGLCGTTHAWNEVYWKALGFPARRREFPNHVNSEIFYENQWHAFDSDMAGPVFKKNGVVAGYADIQRDPSLIDSPQVPIPHYPFAWPADFRTMKKGWQEVAKRESWYKLYNGGCECHPAIVQLRAGESFTRWYDRDHFGGFGKRRFRQNQKGGPHRTWSYFNSGKPIHNAGDSNSRNEATYCNGEFRYKPVLDCEDCAADLEDHSANVGFRDQSPKLWSNDQLKATATFRHFSPYVICGDPVDDVNPMTGAATDGLVVTGIAIGDVQCHVSADQGQSWQSVKLSSARSTAAGVAAQRSRPFTADITEHVKGRYGWLVRFTWSQSAGIDRLEFVTTTQVCQAMYPRLTENGCEVQYQSQPRGVVAVLPDFGVAEENVGRFEEIRLRSRNLKYAARTATNRYPYQASNDQPATVVFMIKAPKPIKTIHAAVRYQIPVTPTPGCDFRLAYSIDEGQSWTEFARAEIAADNEFSSGWLSGKAEIEAGRTTAALVRVHLHTPGRKAALIDAQLYAVHSVSLPGPVSVEFGWLEDGILRTDRSIIGPGTNATTLRIPTHSGKIRDQFVRIAAEPF